MNELNLTKVQQFLKLTFCILLSFIISMTEISMPGLSFNSIRTAEAALPTLQVNRVNPQTIISIANNSHSLIASGDIVASSNSVLSNNSVVKASLLSDNSIFRASLKSLVDLSKNSPTNLNPKLINDLAPRINLAPSLSLIGDMNFFVDKIEINLIKNNYGQSDPVYTSLSFYEQGVKAIESNDDDDAIKYFNLALDISENSQSRFVTSF
ncbi:hypothetical protein MEO94_26025 [Dolichospermum sp. ST_sed9]|nr:hypothetical protein [Dolichospermum sp. ST_sed9]